MPKIRVLIVDDSTVIRRLVSEVIGKDPDIEVIGTAPNGKIALAKLVQQAPDLITLDVEMPEMDGVTALREIRKTHPKIPVIMFSTLTLRGAAITLEALGAGASDYVTKPTQVGNLDEAIRRLETELIPKIRAHCKHILPQAPIAASSSTPPSIPRQRAAGVRGDRIDLVCIGTSTGGPNALAEVVKALPASLEVPVVVVQHMPPVFTQMLAERLTTLKGLICHEGSEGMTAEPGHLYIAPGGKHMEVVRGPDNTTFKLRLHEGPPENSCRPAADVLFRSVARLTGARTLAVVMTGMGQDALKGCELIREQGGWIVAQDEATSVVWGMPGYVVQAGLADKVVPLNQIAFEITRRVRDNPAVIAEARGAVCR